jgi:hypothetical protein
MRSYKIMSKKFEYTFIVLPQNGLNTYVLSNSDNKELLKATETGEGFVFKNKFDKFIDYANLDELYLLLKCIEHHDKLIFDSYTMYDKIITL